LTERRATLNSPTDLVGYSRQGKRGPSRIDCKSWLHVHGEEGLLRTNSKLRGSKDERQEKKKELQPEAFNGDPQRIGYSQLAKCY